MRALWSSMVEVYRLILRTDKLWLLPVALALIILCLLIVSAHLAPIPLFLYPLI